MTTSPPGPPPVGTGSSGQAFRRLAVNVGGVIISGLVINWLSDEYTPTGPILFVFVVVALAFLVASESPGSRIRLNFLTQANKDVLKFGLAAFLVGAMIAGIWLLPLGDTRRFQIPDYFGVQGPPSVVSGIWTRIDGLVLEENESAFAVSNFGIGAVCSMTVLGLVAAARKARLRDLLVYSTAITGGMALLYSTMVSLSFLYTFIGSWAVVTGALVICSLLPDIVRLFRRFWRV